MPPLQQVAIIGVGLLGGSIAKALKKRGLVREIVGIGRSPERLAQGVAAGLIDRGETDWERGLEGADLAIVCTPVDQVARHVITAASHLPPTAWITDVASTKEGIVAEVEQALPGGSYIGSHPLAGDHRSGAEYSREDLYDGKIVVVTPTSETPAELVDQASQFWQLLGARVELLGPGEHDAALARTSHLPHLVATALALATPQSLGRLAATGWLDTTRVAGGEAGLWRPIFTSNRAEVTRAVAQFQAQLDRLREAIVREDDEALEQLLAEGKQIRDALGS